MIMRKKKKEKEVSLSRWAESEISNNYDHYFGTTTIVSVIVGLVWIVVCLFALVLGAFGKPLGESGTPWTFKRFLFWMGIFVLSSSFVFLANYILVGRRYKRRKNEILAENETDHQRSLRLKPVLDNFSSVDVSNFQVLEKEATGTWRPFRVEHFLSDSIKSQIFGQTELKLFSLRSTVRGVSYSVSTPNLLDSSSVLFLKDNAGKTLRALIPSPRATKEMIIGAMKKWFSDIPENTHTHGVLEECSFSEKNVAAPISHPQLVDSLDSSCELTFEKRPIVSVIGEEIQKGVVIATALEVDGKKNIFLPSGFFKQLADSISSAVQNVLPAPTAIEAVKAG